MPTGFAIPLPAISGAEPCTGSNKDGNLFSGFIFADGAIPTVPVQAGPKSDKYLQISLKQLRHQRFQVTIQILQLIYQYEIDQLKYLDNFSSFFQTLIPKWHRDCYTFDLVALVTLFLFLFLANSKANF